MSEKNRHSQPFIMVLSLTVILFAASQYNTEYNLPGYKAKKVSPLADILQTGRLKRAPLPKPVVNDSIISKDSVAYAKRDADSSNIIDFPVGDTSSALAHFFDALNKLKKEKGKVRIAYFGDSMIEGDLITQDLRGEMQNTFGGDGVGFVPVTSIVAGFRTSVIHQFGSWTTRTLLDNIPAGHVLGISGYSFTPDITGKTDTNSTAGGSWVKYSTVKQKHLDKFYRARLLYGKSSGDNYAIINNAHYKLDGTNPVNEVSISSEKGMQALSAKFQSASPIDIFGFSMESDTGVYVDNFSFRGNSGFPLIKVPQSVYSGTGDYLGYDLIVLEYGLNAVSPEVTDFSWYARGMLNVIRHIRASFPHASILLISVGDKSYRKDGVYQTDPSVPLLVKLQKQMAEETGCAYWSLYDAMGGEGSMVKWVEGDTVMANKDYTHFNFRGAHKVGRLLYSKLMSEYADYNKKNNK